MGEYEYVKAQLVSAQKHMEIGLKALREGDRKGADSAFRFARAMCLRAAQIAGGEMKIPEGKS